MKQFYNSKLFFWILTAIVILFTLVFFSFRGMTYYDEGYVLNAALRTLHGEIPYKDFDMVYTPLSFVITSWFLFIFGESLLAERIAAFVVTIFTILAIFYILKLFTKNLYLIFIALLLFVVWGPMHINFAWPVMFAMCFLFYSILFYLLGINSKQKKFFILTGIMTILVFLSKQNFGTGTFVVYLGSIFFMPKTLRKTFIYSYLIGICSVSGLYFLYLLITSSLIPFIENMYIYTLKRVFIDKGLDTPFLYEGSLLTKATKFMFYTSPLLISVLLLLQLIKKHKKFLVIPFLIITFYLLGVRPTTDYVHVSPLIALTCIPLTLLIIYIKKKQYKILVLCIMVAFIILGSYTAYFKGYYQWEAPMKDYTYYSDNSRTRLFLIEDQSANAISLQKYVQLHTKENDYIFVYYYAPLVYFLTDRKNPTPYDLISTNQLPVSYQRNIINILREKNVRLVMLHEFNKKENAIVADYIRMNYKHTKTIAGFLIFEK